MIANSGSFSLVIDFLLHLSLTLLFTIAKHLYLAFEDGSPYFSSGLSSTLLNLSLIPSHTGLLPSMGSVFQMIQ